MKKKYSVIILFISLFLININEINATSGQLRKDSIKTCNGIMYGQHGSDDHWHQVEDKGGRYYPVGDAIYSDPCQSINNQNNHQEESTTNNDVPPTNENNQVVENEQTSTETIIKNETTQNKEEIKSSDNTLKTLIIDNLNIEIKDNIEYQTYDEKIAIKVETNHEKATYEIKSNEDLLLGENNVIIEVKAEDETIKTYNIKVIRSKKLSSDTGIKVIIDNEELIFENFKAEVDVDSNKENIDFKYKLNDLNAKVEIDKLENIKTGDNIINILVIAEDGTKQNYEINIYKYSKTEDIIYFIIGFGTLGGIIYFIYYIINKIRRS